MRVDPARTAATRGLKAAGSALLCAAALSAAAQDFPARPVHVIVPYAAGTGSDVISRMVLTPVAERLKQAVVFDNRPGAGGVVGVKALKDAKPDGYTIGLVVSGNAIQPWITKDMPFDVRKDFAPITLIYSGPLVMAVPQTTPAKTLGEFVSYAKANKLFFGSVGPGTTGHLVGEMLNQSSGLTMTHVPFKGSPDVYNAMLGGNIHAAFDNYNTPKAMVEGGKLRILGVTSAQRVPWLPAVPTFAETFPGFEASFWVGLAAPQGTPKEALDRLTADIRAVIQSPEMKARLTEMGLMAGGMPSAEFGQMLNAEHEKWGKVVRSAGLKPE